MPRAVGAAEEMASALDSVPNYLAFAMLADGRELVDRALKAIEDMSLTRRYHLEAQFVIVAADLALCHACETVQHRRMAGLTVIVPPARPVAAAERTQIQARKDCP